MKASDNITQWIKLGAVQHLTFMQKDIIIYGNGCFLNFLNINTGEEVRHDINMPDGNGDGVGVVTAHRSLYIFCYAENCRHPTFYIKNYPNFNTILKIPNGPSEGYSALAFSETSLLVTVGNLPEFILMMYNWRKGEKIGELRSNLKLEGQVVKCSWGRPVYVSQMCKYHNKLLLWDIFVCCKTAVLEEHEIVLPEGDKHLQFLDTLWTTEGGLYVVDIKGSVYFMINETHLEKVIDEKLEGTAPTSMCWYKGGIAVSGPNNEIRHYKKSGTWECDWKIPLEKPAKMIKCNKCEYIIALTVDEEIIKISNTAEMAYLKQNEVLPNICLIYPAGQHFIGLHQRNRLNIYETVSGTLINSIELKYKALALAENPEFPYVAVGYDTGRLELISAYTPEKLTIIASFNLTGNPIGTVKFFEQGHVIVAGFLDIGEFFLIEGLPGMEMKIITNINADCQILDYMLVASKNCYRLFLLPVTTNILAGDKIIRYCIINRDNITVKEYVLENKEFLYHRIVPTTKPNRDKVFLALPFNSRILHELELRRGDKTIRLHSEIKTGHMLRKYDLHLTKFYALTWGYDGFVLARDNDFEKGIGMALPHHRYLGGVKKAYIHPLGLYILSLGRDNVLVCTKLTQTVVDPERKQSIDSVVASTKLQLMFKRPTIGFKPEARFKHKSWLEVEQILQTEKEEAMCSTEKAEILLEFNDIKDTINDLVTKNIEGPDNEKLDLLEFHLDTALYNQKKELNKQECKNTEIYLKALIVAQDKVSKYLMENCWYTMDVKSQAVKGIFSKLNATNYALLPPDPIKESKLAWIQDQRKFEQFLRLRDSFEPWNVMTDEQRSLLCQEICYKLVGDSENINTLIRKRKAETVTNQSAETQIALAGSAAQSYITVNEAHYEQREITCYQQCYLEEAIVESDILRLKRTFNKVFNDLVQLKQREMAVIKEKNNRVRHIISEYNYFSESKISYNVIDPEWSQKEITEMITQVFDHELSVTPYISPSEQAVLDAKAAEEERIRLALLADDFKERALMAMMNGVLEVKWEDELKKEVPLPKCMIEKSPETFNEEDLRSVKDYEEKVAFLNSERERYKNMLEAEFTKVTVAIRDQIRKFNQKVRDTIDYRMQIAATINQENLKINRIRLMEDQRLEVFARKEGIKKAIKTTENAITNLKKTISFVQEALGECKTNLENIVLKEKVLEKAFKKDFQDASPVLQEQAIKYYKKRPKVNYRQLNSFTTLFELARCIATQERSPVLTHECNEYLKALDQLDQFVGLPPTIDENTYSHICKHRRLRIEFEVRTRAVQNQVADGEATLTMFQKRVVVNKETVVKLLAELQRTRTDYLYLMHNIQMQVVLRRGLVELPLTGDIADFQDAVLVPKKEIEEINKLILDAGNKKIQTIMQNMAFRRNIMTTEWEHRKLRLTINDLAEKQADIESVKLNKDMQVYLKAKALGRKTDQDSFEVELERIAFANENRVSTLREKYAKLEKMIQSYKHSNIDLDKQISSLNIDVCHLGMLRNEKLEEKEQEVLKSRMEGLLKQTSLVEQIQKNQSEILVLQTELELLRLRTYPTFRYKLINP
ncbi:hypothetical protein NQ315_008456 [Exocentrus adspersus]|uniref:Cilia- and flagella-associated protein 43 n=1 Tax=Exocentrus adspersus TaxID=1586481 RepID=A0AAV8W653_9CUCU|nr:hypothetical protein NQ315_008456 [Exocentrus adspersus]